MAAIVVSNLSNASSFISGKFKPVISVSAATTLTSAQSGSVVLVGKGAAYTLTLPTPTTAGQTFTLIGGAVAAFIVTVDSSAAALLSGIAIHNTAVALIANKACRNIRFLAASVTGDKVDLVSDGTQWNAVGFGGVGAASFDFT